MKRAVVGWLVAAQLGLAGCAATFWAGNHATTVGIGMSKVQAETLLGPPRQMMRQELNGVLVETWKYADRSLIFHDGILKEIRRYEAPKIPEIPGVD